MTEQIQPGSAVSDDIDLLLLIEKVVAYFGKYKWIFIAAIVAGIATGIYFYNKQPKVYSSRLVAHSFLLTNQEEIQIIDSWNQLLGKHEYAALAALFECNEKMLHAVKQIKGDEIQKVFSPNNPNGFLIEVSTSDIAVLDSLEPAVVRGLENNGYVKQRLTAKRQNLNQQIERTNREIKRLDSTKDIVERLIRTNERPASISDLTSLNQQLMNMNDKLMSYKDELEFAKGVQVLQGFNKINQPSGPKLFVWLFLGLVFYLSLAFVYTIIRTVSIKLKRHSANAHRS